VADEDPLDFLLREVALLAVDLERPDASDRVVGRDLQLIRPRDYMAEVEYFRIHRGCCLVLLSTVRDEAVHVLRQLSGVEALRLNEA